MRLAIAALTLLGALSSAQPALALTVCPTSQFTIVFETDSAQLDAGDLELTQAAVARVRQCYVDALELVVAGDLETEESLAARRASAVRDAFISNGLSADLIHAMNMSRETCDGRRTLPTPDGVTVLIFFDYGRPH